MQGRRSGIDVPSMYRNRARNVAGVRLVQAPSFGGRGIVVPARSPLFAWCLDRGLQIKQVMTLMSVGLYNEPMGAYLSSITYLGTLIHGRRYRHGPR